ncbi:Hypothetical predicted protein [Marmota monax]|uniref:Uncharacterized protein n=1 Tax=Marmota monax TaxID=9995 RepID=A0A5E4BDN3_MARMO|nr:Hypothetical predicted protein [Marmota monax]
MPVNQMEVGAWSERAIKASVEPEEKHKSPGAQGEPVWPAEALRTLHTWTDPDKGFPPLRLGLPRMSIQSQPTLLELAGCSLLSDKSRAILDLEDLPIELFSPLFVEAFSRRHTEVLKKMV